VHAIGNDASGTVRRTVSRLHVDRGLHVLRYVSSAAGEYGPSVAPVVGPEAAGKIRLISAPDNPGCELVRPGECLVVVAEIAGTVRLVVTPRGPQGSRDAVLRLELLEQRRQAGAQAERLPAAVKEPFRFIAHLSRRGDVEVAAGEWAGGPGVAAPLEGLTILGRRVETRALSAVEGERRWSTWAPAGTFLGSRGRAQPLLGLSIKIEEGQDPESELAIEAMFLGSPIVQKRGREIEVVGPSGGGPLVGLRIELVQAEKGRKAPLHEVHAPPEPRARLLRPRVGQASI
jgi:hypothetical protein